MAVNPRAAKRQVPWLSLLLLLTAYASFGWFLCHYAFPLVDSLPEELSLQECLDRVLLKPALPKVVLLATVGGCILLCLLFMRPLSNFTFLISHWFKSDTIAFLTIAILAGLVTVVLYWLQVFLFVITIAAAGALARIDLQTHHFSSLQSFWLLSSFSLVGLISGWSLRVLI
jgi:hypothetical protein